MIDALAPLQTTPAFPEPTGGGTSPLAILTVVAAVGYVVQTRTSVDLLGLVPSGGGAGGSSSGGSGGDDTGGGVLGFVTSINGLAIGALTLLSALIIGGALDVPEGTGVPFVVALELIAAGLILDELGGLSPRLFVAVVAATTVLGLSALGEPVVGTIVNSPVGVFAVLGTIALLWRALGDRTRRIVVRGEVEDDGGGE